MSVGSLVFPLLIPITEASLSQCIMMFFPAIFSLHVLQAVMTANNSFEDMSLNVRLSCGVKW